MATVVDLLAGANWQRGGGKGAKPKPVPRPAELKKKADDEKRLMARAARFVQRQLEKRQLNQGR